MIFLPLVSLGNPRHSSCAGLFVEVLAPDLTTETGMYFFTPRSKNFFYDNGESVQDIQGIDPHQRTPEQKKRHKQNLKSSDARRLRAAQNHLLALHPDPNNQQLVNMEWLGAIDIFVVNQTGKLFTWRNLENYQGAIALIIQVQVSGIGETIGYAYQAGMDISHNIDMFFEIAHRYSEFMNEGHQ